MAAGDAVNSTAEWRPWAWKSKRRLKFWTNFCLVMAIGLGMALAARHGGRVTNTIAWSGAALAAGSLFGFLFGIPGHSGRRIIINQPGVAAIDTGINRASGTGGVGTNTGGEQSQEPADGSAEPSPAKEASAEGVSTAGAAAGRDTTEGGANGGGINTGKPSADSNNEPSTDSNLVQVSDWVTKLLLGGGLTQLQQIPGKIWELAGWVAIGIDPSAAVRGQEPALHANQSFAAGVLIYFALLGFFAGYFITQLQFGKKLKF